MRFAHKMDQWRLKKRSGCIIFKALQPVFLAIGVVLSDPGLEEHPSVGSIHH